MEDRLALVGTMQRMKQIGFICPYAGAHTCAATGEIGGSSGFINIADLEKLLQTADRKDGVVSAEDALSSEEIQKFQGWVAEDMPLGVDSRMLASALTTNLSTLFANGTNAKISANSLQSQEQVDTTDVFIAATTKPCPNCKFSITHWHGHSCHHISPAGGCPKCKVGFCYKCLQSATTNQQRRGAANRCLCDGWSNFCNDSGIRDNINVLPYPHDKRCGCCICPDCSLGSPCGTCNGRCVVCQGIVPPGPRELDPKWNIDSGPAPTPQNTRASLFDACRDGDANRIRAIMNSPNVTFNANIRDNIHRTPLFYAIDSGNIECVLLLLTAYQADTSATDTSGNTPLHHAIEIVHEDITRAILETSPNMNVNVANNDHVTPLLIAVNHSSLVLSQLLLSCGANHRIVDSSGASLLHIAARNGCSELCRLFTSDNAHLLPADAIDNYRKYPLHYAAESGVVETARLLVEEQASKPGKSAIHNYVMKCDMLGKIPLHYALMAGKVLMTEYLISLDPESSVYFTTGLSAKTTLMYAVEGGHVDVVRALLNCRNQIPVETKNKGILGFIGGSQYRSMTEKQFIDLKPVFSKSNETAISRAWRDGHYDIVVFLFERGAELFFPAKRLLQECCGVDPPAVPVIRALLRSGKVIETDFQLLNGQNLLYTTCFQPEVFELLLENSTLPVDGPNKEETVAWKIVSMMMREAPSANTSGNVVTDFFTRLFTRATPSDYVDRSTCIRSFQLLLRHRNLRVADYSISSMSETNSYSSLFDFALRKGLVELFRSLVENDLTIFGLSLEMERALLADIFQYDRVEFFRVLAGEFGTRFRFGIAPDDDHPAYLLHDACAAGAFHIAKHLLEQGVNANEIRQDSNLESPIHCVKDSVNLVELLRRHGAVLRVKDAQGRLPLHRAVLDGHAKLLRHYLRNCRRNFVLLMLTADSNSKYFADTDIFVVDNANETPLMLAVQIEDSNRSNGAHIRTDFFALSDPCYQFPVKFARTFRQKLLFPDLQNIQLHFMD
eukprot:gene27034-35743_t